jgi:hypothetical protein
MPPLDQTGIRLSLPYDHDPSYPEWLAEHRLGVAEVYFPLHRSVAPSGRPWLVEHDAAAYQAHLESLARSMNQAGIRGNVVVNALVLDAQRLPALRALGQLAETFDAFMVTVTDFEFARAVRRDLPEVDLGVSTLADVGTVQRARYWRDAVGPISISVARSINKRPAALRAIRDLGVAIELVLDDHCVPDCPASLSHLRWLVWEPDALAHGCEMDRIRREEPWRLAQKDVVPATLPRYAGLVDVAKLEGRTKPLEFVARKLARYLAAESYEHPYGFYTEPPDAFDRIVACDRDCAACRWCPDHFAAPDPDRLPSAAHR